MTVDDSDKIDQLLEKKGITYMVIYIHDPEEYGLVDLEKKISNKIFNYLKFIHSREDFDIKKTKLPLSNPVEYS